MKGVRIVQAKNSFVLGAFEIWLILVRILHGT